MVKIHTLMYKAFFLIIFSSALTYANQDSLMLSTVEVSALKSAQESAQKAIDPNMRLRLDGIVFHGPQKWTVWLNGIAYQSTSALKSSWKIVEVTSQSVKLSLNGLREPVTLSINQSIDQ